MAVINAPLVLSRASSATLVDSVTGLLTEFGNNLPRFDTGLGLLIEGQRQNIYLNSTVGVSTGAVAPNLNQASTDIASINPTLLIRKHTRDNATGDSNVGSGPAQYAITTGVNMAYSIWVYLPSSQNYGASPSFNVEYDSAHTLVSSVSANFAVRDRWQRIQKVFTPTSTGTAPLVLRFIGSTGSFLYTCAPQVEVGSLPSQHIITTGTAATRLADILSVPLSSLGIGSNGACTVVVTFTFPQIGPFSIYGFPNGFELNAGDINNRAWIYFNNGLVWLARVNAAVNQQIQIGGGITPNSLCKVAFSGDGTGRFAASFNGGTVQNITGAPTSLSQFRVGSGFGGDQPINGYAQVTSILPYPVSDATLPRFSTI